MSDTETTAAPLDRFAAAAPTTVTVERTTAEGFGAALADAVEPPAVGTRLPFPGVALADADAPVTPFPGAEDADGERGRLLRTARTGVTPAGLAVAERGTISVRSRAAGDELVSLYPERHVAVLRASDVVPDVRAALGAIGDDARRARDESEAGAPDAIGDATASAVLATRASVTADMGALVEGVHGPQEVVVVALSD